MPQCWLFSPSPISIRCQLCQQLTKSYWNWENAFVMKIWANVLTDFGEPRFVLSGLNGRALKMQEERYLCALVLNMQLLCPGTDTFYGPNTDLFSPPHLWTSQKLAGCCQSSQRAPFKRCSCCECQSCTNLSNSRQCKTRVSICRLWLSYCKGRFQGTSIHPVHIVRPVFKLSGLQYGHNAMIPCVSFLIVVRCNWIVVMYSHVQVVTKRSWCVSTSLTVIQSGNIVTKWWRLQLHFMLWKVVDCIWIRMVVKSGNWDTS